MPIHPLDFDRIEAPRLKVFWKVHYPTARIKPSWAYECPRCRFEYGFKRQKSAFEAAEEHRASVKCIYNPRHRFYPAKLKKVVDAIAHTIEFEQQFVRHNNLSYERRLAHRIVETLEHTDNVTIDFDREIPS